MNWLFELAESVEKWSPSSADAHGPGDDADPWYSIALITALVKHCDAAPPSGETVRQWRDRYVAMFDVEMVPAITDEATLMRRRVLVEETFGQLLDLADRATTWSPSRPASAEAEGVLTSLTRQLPPERALDLYRKIAPVFVHQILAAFYKSSSLDLIRRMVDHLCSEAVQQRLRRHAHVRDAILEELCLILGQSQLCREISRTDLERLLVESGAIHELIAMENCIKLAASKAG